ncbi:hypothetical protein [Amycolatopsis sp. ATCC 39116]|nr:hypothetical protein [Amycolatopsis sp. ATCC 39116]
MFRAVALRRPRPARPANTPVQVQVSHRLVAAFCGSLHGSLGDGVSA